MYYNMMLRLVGLVVLCLSLFCVGVGAETVQFSIQRFEITGNTLISSDELERQVAPFIGANKVYGDIQKALEAVESAYRERGYGAVHVLVPEQELTQGVVRFNVMEAKLGKISVVGNSHFDEQNILATLPGLRLGTTPNARVLSESVQLANENPARKMDVVLGISGAGDNDDELNARIDVKDEKPWAVYLSSDNTGNKETGRDRTGISLQHANLFNRDQVGTFSYTSSIDRPQSTRIYSLSYRLPIYAWGDSVDLYYGNSDVASATSATVAGPLLFSGAGSVYGLRYNHILPRKGEYSHRFIFGYDRREFDNTCTLGGQAVCGAGGADITLRPLSVSYSGQNESLGGISNLFLSLSGNLAGGNHGSSADFEANRLGASPNYSVFRGSLSHTQVVGNDWQLRGAINMQYTRDALVSGEQLGLVGAMAVRGFDERALTSDKGYYGLVEVYTPDLAARNGFSGNLRLLGFYDFGQGSFNKIPPGLYDKMDVASVGIGLRYTLDRKASARADLARVVDGGTPDTAEAGDWRGHVSIVIGF